MWRYLAALRELFDWLVTGQVLSANPATSVRGPRHQVKSGKTPILSVEAAREILAAIETDTEKGLRDRALIAMMIYTFARVGAVLGMKRPDYFVSGRRGWVRLSEKGGKQYSLPCHHKLEQYLEDYMVARGEGRLGEPLFQSVRGRGLSQQDVYRMVRQRAIAAGVKTSIGCHTFRVTGITAYLRQGGKLETAQHMAGHESPRTIKLYDRREMEVAQEEVERIGI